MRCQTREAGGVQRVMHASRWNCVGSRFAMNVLITRESVFSQVHRYVRNKILRGDYPEGTRLLENRIAAELKISRTPVREALVLLAGQGLVRTQDGGGFIVSDVRQQLLDILDIRIALECHAVGRAAPKISAEEIETLERLCDEMEALSPEDIEARAEMNRRFHAILIGAAQNARLVAMVNDYQDYFRTAQPLFDPEAIRRTQAEHRAITKALRAHDVERARGLVADHIKNAGLHIMKQFEARNRARGGNDETRRPPALVK